MSVRPARPTATSTFLSLFHLRLAVRVGEGHLYAVLGLLHLLNSCAGVHVDAALFEEARNLLGNFLVLDRNHARQKFENGHLCAEGAEERAEFHAHSARADDDERFRNLVHCEDFDVGQDAVVGFEPGEHFGLGASGENHVFRFYRADFSARRRDFNRVHAALRRAGQSANALDARDLVLLHQEIETLGVLGDDGVLALEHRGPVERGRADAPNAKISGVLQVVPDFGVEEQGLGRDAAHVEAGAAELVGLLNQRHFQSVLSAANGRRVTGWPAANNRHIINRLCRRLVCQGELHSGARQLLAAPPATVQFNGCA